MTDLDACLPPAPLRIAAAAIACFAGWSTADTVTVGPGGDFATIQAAIDAAEAGDAIEIDPGVYAESLSMRLPITLRPIAGAASGSVVIDPGGLGICVLVSGVAAPGVRLQGLTLRDGAAGAIAGGISSSNSHVVVSDCTFENHSGGLGGAIGIDGGSLVVQRSTFRNNAAFDGGAIDIASGAAVEIRDSVFIDNTALSTGGAINAIASSQVEIIGCTFVRNEAALLGGAITMGTGAQADIARCTFDSNHSDEFGGAIAVGATLTTEVRDSTFTNNTAIDGGGAIDAFGATLLAEGCRFFENSSAMSGGAVNVFGNQTNITLLSCVLVGNGAVIGGAGAVEAGPVTVTPARIVAVNCTAVANSAPLASSFATVDASAIVRVRDSILQHGGVGEVGGPGVLDVAGSIVEGGFIAAAGLPANIDVDPMFVDAAAGDFTPLPGSPAVDASASPPLADALGSISSMSRDAAGLPRSVDDPAAPNASNASFIDIGAVERQPCAPDINRDGVLDIDDFSAFVNAFFASDLVADVNRDNSLDIDDFSSFVSSFFAGC